MSNLSATLQESFADIPMNGVGAYIANLAKEHGIAYAKTGSSALADDDVKPDETEKLVMVLAKQPGVVALVLVSA